jgi:Flp pilus assembly protein TadG
MMKLRMKPSRIRSRARCGVAAVEFALIAPLLILTMLGAIDVGRFINVGQIVNDASREGARQASRNAVTNVSEVDAVVLSYLRDAFRDPSLTATINVTDSSGAPISGGDLTKTSSGSSSSGSSLRVTVALSYDKVRWMAGFPGVSGKTLTTTTVMRRE